MFTIPYTYPIPTLPYPTLMFYRTPTPSWPDVHLYPTLPYTYPIPTLPYTYPTLYHIYIMFFMDDIHLHYLHDVHHTLPYIYTIPYPTYNPHPTLPLPCPALPYPTLPLYLPYNVLHGWRTPIPYPTLPYPIRTLSWLIVTLVIDTIPYPSLA